MKNAEDHMPPSLLEQLLVWMITGHADGIAAAMALKDGATVQKVNVAALQDKLRAQHQVIDFIPSQPEKCEHLNGPPEF